MSVDGTGGGDVGGFMGFLEPMDVSFFHKSDRDSSIGGNKFVAG